MRGCCAGDNITDSPSGFAIANVIVGDPMFADPQTMDFRLRPGSPAIGTATDGSNSRGLYCHSASPRSFLYRGTRC